MEAMFILGAVTMGIGAIVLAVRLRKTKNPARVARALAIISLICGIIHIVCQFLPFEYTGGKGIDYIGQAIAHGLLVAAVLYSTLGAYIIFAIVATVYTVKAAKAKDKHKKSWLTLLIAWACAIALAGMVVVNVISRNVRDKSIHVYYEEAVQTKDIDGDPAVIISLRLENGTKSEIYYLGSIYDEVTQNGKELSHASTHELIGKDDTELEKAPPGGSVIVRKAYKLKEPGSSVHILCRTYDGRIVYLDQTVTPA